MTIPQHICYSLTAIRLAKKKKRKKKLKQHFDDYRNQLEFE